MTACVVSRGAEVEKNRGEHLGTNAPRSLAELPVAWARHWPQALASADLSAACSFAQLEEASRRWAHALLDSGLGPGSRVALWGGNGVRWLERAFGVWRAGATLVPVSTFATPRELAEILESARPDALLFDGRVGERDLFAVWRDTATRHMPTRSVLCGATVSLAAESPCTEEQFLSRAEGNRALPEPREQHIALVLYTSGTTGKPKGVRLSHASVLSTIGPTAERGGLLRGDRVYSSLPLFWVAGLVIRTLPTLFCGAAILLTPTFSPAQCREILYRFRPNGLHLRPPQVASLLADPQFDPSLLHGITKGGGRVSWYAGHLRGARMITGYGMTEMSGYVTSTVHANNCNDESAVGTPLPGIEIRIVDEHGQELNVGRVGEIRVRGPGLFSGYDCLPPGTGLDDHGFFCTGDLGFLDDSGALHFAGRVKDLLRVKGVNVSPAEVEGVLMQHPTIDLAYVVGLPPDGSDQELVAIVVPRGGNWEEAAWRAWCNAQLSSYKRPSRYLRARADELPYGPTSKPSRAELARLAQRKLEEPA